jgi:hypothetical protein
LTRAGAHLAEQRLLHALAQVVRVVRVRAVRAQRADAEDDEQQHVDREVNVDVLPHAAAPRPVARLDVRQRRRRIRALRPFAAARVLCLLFVHCAGAGGVLVLHAAGCASTGCSMRCVGISGGEDGEGSATEGASGAQQRGECTCD